MRLKTKLTSLFLACGTLPLCGAIVCSLYTANSGFQSIESQSTAAVESQVNDQLNAVRDIKKSQIENYFETISNQVKTFSNNRAIVDAMVSFKADFNGYKAEVKLTDESISDMRKKLASYYGKDFSDEYANQNDGKNPSAQSWLAQLDDEAVALQYQYISQNSNPLGSKHLLMAAEDNSTYSKNHAKYHPMIANFLDKFGYYDIFLVDPDSGDIVYSVYKELDYATSLKDGPYRNTNFASCFAQANAAENEDDIVLVDYKQYAPSYEAPASFIASPIFEGDKKVGILMFQMPISYINQVMGLRSGMGETGETYLVGGDYLMRCDSFHDPENRSIVNSFRKPKTGSVETEAVDLALEGKSGTIRVSNYSDQDVLCSYAPVEILGNRWALLAEITTEEAFKSAEEIAITSSNATSSLLWYTCFIGILSSLGVAVTGWVFSGKIARPIREVADFAHKISIGQFSDEKLTHHSKDETGELADSFRTMSDVIVGLTDETSRLASEANNGNLTARGDESKFQGCYQQLVVDMNELVGAFNGALTQVSTITTDVSKASSEVHESSQSIASGATQQASSLEEIASSLEEMTSMTRHSSDNANQANLLAKETRTAADKGKSSMVRMSDAIEKIKSSSDEQAKIVKTIDEIAFQTNLLALNAAVEAARAGEAGKGFAVVAEEVRNLAQRSAEAARTTATMIETSVESSNNGVKISKEVADILEAINVSAQKTDDLISEIAAASTESSQGIDQVNSAISQLDETTQQSAETSQQSAETATTLTRNVEELHQMVARFQLTEDSGATHQLLESIHESVNSRPKKRSKVLVGAGTRSAQTEKMIPFGDDDFSDF